MFIVVCVSSSLKDWAIYFQTTEDYSKASHLRFSLFLYTFHHLTKGGGVAVLQLPFCFVSVSIGVEARLYPNAVLPPSYVPAPLTVTAYWERTLRARNKDMRKNEGIVASYSSRELIAAALRQSNQSTLCWMLSMNLCLLLLRWRYGVHQRVTESRVTLFSKRVEENIEDLSWNWNSLRWYYSPYNEHVLQP